MLDEENERQIQASQREYLEFLDDEEIQGVYHSKVKEMIDGNETRVIININDLRKNKPERADALLSHAAIEQRAFQKALNQYATSLNPSLNNTDYHVGFEGSFGYRHLTPRSLRAHYINNMICLEGIVTQCSLTKPKLVKSVHYCPATGKILERKYADLTSLEPVITNSIYPSQDAEGNLLETEFGLSEYKDHQTLVMQEMPERAPAGQLPRSIDVICDHDLSDKCKPGDRVQIVGIYLCLPSKKNSFTSAVFQTALLANHITHLNKESKVAMTRNDISNCRKMGRKNNIFELLSNSLAPSIHGHLYVKKAILCMLLGGVEKYLPSGTRIRGDINILLIGDPSVAKSQLLRYVLCTAPRAIATTGRGSSGVGLTAAITHDQATGERKLEAGAMVLADRGIVCIDEFDKMSDIDRTAIHEVMEQGRVTITKAGINARLNARCSVLAAANPIYGRYDRYRPPMENIGLQDSLLSRFDLIFVMLDEVQREQDSRISDHVLRMHQYRNPSEPDGAVLPMGAGVEFLTTGNIQDLQTESGPISIFEKYDPLLHGNMRSKTDRIFTIRFMQMYLQFAKSIKPVLTDESCAVITQKFAELRSEKSVESGFARTQPVTVRTLETLIRLATAHAKARLSNEVKLEDAEAAIELVQFAYFKKVVQKKPQRRNSEAEDDPDEVQENGDDEPEDNNSNDHNGDDPFEFHSQEQNGDEPAPRPQQRIHEPQEPMEISDEPSLISEQKLNIFKQRLFELFQESHKDFLNYRDTVIAFETDGFTRAEINAAIENMASENQIMHSADLIIRI